MSGESTNTTPGPILISGGGIGGLACALALAQKGFRVTVCEQAPQFGQIGAGLQVAPNALSVLDALGVGEEVKRHAVHIEQMLMMDGVSGDAICQIPCDDPFRARFGNPYTVAHRADVHGALLRACKSHESVELRTGFRITGYAQDADGVSAISDTGESLRGVALIGADGVRSRIRHQMLDDGDPVRVGAVIYRALIPADRMPKELQHPRATLWAGPGAHLIYYPMRGWSEFNVGATVNRAVIGLEEGEASCDEAMVAFSKWTEIPQRVLSLTSKYQRYIIRHRQPVDSWTQGKVTLLGDAAHPMVQYIAQGAAMALEDALCLAAELDAAKGDFEKGFARYQQQRIVRSARVQISSAMMDRIYHVGDVERLVRNSIFQSRSPTEHFDRMAWLFAPPDYVRSWRPQERAA